MSNWQHYIWNHREKYIQISPNMPCVDLVIRGLNRHSFKNKNLFTQPKAMTTAHKAFHLFNHTRHCIDVIKPGCTTTWRQNDAVGSPKQPASQPFIASMAVMMSSQIACICIVCKNTTWASSSDIMVTCVFVGPKVG